MLPKIGVPLVTYNQLNGIIYEIKNTYKIDPIVDEIIVPKAFKDCQGTRNTLVYWNDSYDAGDGTVANGWFQLSFPKGFIYPTAYSLRGANVGWYFSDTWNVYGIYENDEEKEEKWILLAENDLTQSDYCKNRHDSRCYDGTNIGTYALRQVSTKGFKHLRWKLKTVYDSMTPYFPSSGVDVYGVLSSSSAQVRNRKYVCYCRSCAAGKLIMIMMYGDTMVS